MFFLQLLNAPGKVYRVVQDAHIPHLSAALRDGIAGVLVNPPRYKISHPAIRIGIAGGSNIGPDAASGAVSAQHIEELFSGKVCQLVKAEVTNFCALPALQVIIACDVGEVQAGTTSKRPVQLRGHSRHSIRNKVVNLVAGIPEAALGGDLRVVVTEDNTAKTLYASVPQALQ